MNHSLIHSARGWPLAVLSILLGTGLAACQPRTNVAATANVPPQYSHVWVTMRQVEFNSSATAGPGDSGWQQFTLPSPQTIDLAATDDGALSQFASNLSLPAGTYLQMRVVLADSTDALTSSAQSAGALYNDEVDYTDSAGTAHQVPLAIPNAALGIGFGISLKVQSANNAALAALGCASGASSMAGTGGYSPYGLSAFGTTLGSPLGTNCAGYGSPFGMLGTSSLYGTSAYGTSPYGTSPYATSPYATMSPNGTSPYATSPYATSPYATSPYATSPYATSPYGTSPYATSPYGTSPYATSPYGTAGYGTSIYGASPYAATANGTTACAAGATYDPTTGTCVAGFGNSSCSFGANYDPTTGACTTTSLNTAATTTTTIDFDGARDLVPYTVGGQPGYVLIPHPAGFDLSQAGTIQGQVTVAALPAGIGGVEVTAESLSSDGTRHVAVQSAPLRSDGSFVLYPLSTASGSPTQYDLVIHGPDIATVIIKSVPVATAAPSSAGAASLTGVTLASAGSFAANIASSSAVQARGAWIGFYQTLPGSGEVPYLIEARPIDPFTGIFDSDQSLSAGDLAYGTYASGVSLTAATPVEGTATYRIAASAPVYGDGALGATVAAPSTGTAMFTVAAPAIPSGSTADSVAGTISVATPGKFDKGELLLTQNGALVATAPLDAYLASAQSPATLFSAVPGGSAGTTFADGLYYAEVWAWSSADPAGTLSRQPQTAAIDLRNGSASSVAIDIQ